MFSRLQGRIPILYSSSASELYKRQDLDRFDRNILNELQKDGRISNVELSKRVGLSPTPCLERVRRLERQGYISGYTALLNPQYLDASLLVFVEITLNRGAPDVFEQFNTAVQKLDDIQECHLVSGDFDYLLKTRVSDMSAYRKLLGDTLLRLPGVNDTRTYVVMEEVKQTNQLVIKIRLRKLFRFGSLYPSGLRSLGCKGFPYSDFQQLGFSA